MSKKTHYREDSYVLCPYYRKEAPIEIKCVGICGSHTLNVFENSKKKIEFKDDFCCGLYKACALYQALELDDK